MATASAPHKIWSKPGISRDSTRFQSECHTDGLWCRWDNLGLPRKIAGVQTKCSTLQGIARGLDLYPNNGQNYVHIGESDFLELLTISAGGVPGALVDVTPTAGFTASPNNLWQFAQMFDSVSTSTNLLAHPGQNLADIDNDVATPIFLKGATDTAVAAEISGSDVSGGVCAIGPFMFYYGSDGFLGWSDVNKPSTLSSGLAGTANPTAQKIVKGMQLRGGVGNAPAGIFWSLDSVIIASFVSGGTVAFSFDTIAQKMSLMSSSCMVEDDGLFYWIAKDRFLMFNGVVQELPNSLNFNYFFDNITAGYTNKVFGFKVPHRGEIWWCAPMFGATECSHAIIYNRRLSQQFGYPVWYDTELPSGRSSAFFPQLYPYPLLGGTDVDALTGGYKLWQHENPGYDIIDGSRVLALKSYFTTNDIAPTVMPQPTSQGVFCEYVAPDFVQTGDMTVQIIGNNTARGPQIATGEQAFPDTVTGDGRDQFVYFKDTRNQMRFKFQSNTQGGNFQDGQPLAYLRPSDGRNIT